MNKYVGQLVTIIIQFIPLISNSVLGGIKLIWIIISNINNT